jgi:hypothetical protein
VRNVRAGATKLREAIKGYEDLFGQNEQLVRLAENSNAAMAFERLKLKNPGDGILILAEYIEAEQLFREFPQRITKAKETLARMGRLQKALNELHKLAAEPPQRSQSELGAMLRGLDLLARRIEAKRCNAEYIVPLFGVTRKARGKEAAQNAAIWYLANAVRRITDKPQSAAVAELAEIILGIGVDLDRVRHVVRYRQQGYNEMVEAQRTRAAKLQETG